MAIVINEFEAVAEAAPRPSAAGGAGAETEGAAPATPEPQQTAQTLHALAQGALRVWAH